MYRFKLKNITSKFHLLILILMTPVLWAGTITNINLDNIETQVAPVGGYVVGDTYFSFIYTDDTSMTSNGAISWVEADVMAPGLDIVNVDDTLPAEELNCIMTSGVNPVDNSVKQCSDPFQTSKRFKFNINNADSSIDLVFDVDLLDVDAATAHVYRVLEKLLNVTDISIANFQIELGFFTAENFIPAGPNMGLDFAASDGNIIVGNIVTGDVTALLLDALFPAGLFGPLDPPKHPFEGYFDPNTRAQFLLQANRGVIKSTGITPNYFDLVGDFLSKSQVMRGFFYDEDNDPLTDPVTIAHETAAGWISFRTLDFWNTQLVPPVSPPPLNLDGTIQAATIASWEADPLYTIGLIEDLANVNLNYHIKVADTATWPTPSPTTPTSKTFTLRISSTNVRDEIFKDGFESSL